MAKRYELPDAAWDLVVDLFTKTRRSGRPRADAQPLLDEAYIPSLRGRPRKRCRWLLANKGFDAEALRRHCDRYRMQPQTPLRDMKRKPKPGLARLFDRPQYRQRNIFERMFGWLKENRRIVTYFDKLATSCGLIGL